MEIFKLKEQDLKIVLEACKTQDYKKAVGLISSGEVRFKYGIITNLISSTYHYDNFNKACEVFVRLKALYRNKIDVYITGVDVQAGEIVKVRWDSKDELWSLQDEKFNLI